MERLSRSEMQEEEDGKGVKWEQDMADNEWRLSKITEKKESTRTDEEEKEEYGSGQLKHMKVAVHTKWQADSLSDVLNYQLSLETHNHSV